MNGTPGKQQSGSAQNVKAHIGTKRRLTQERLKEVLDYNAETGAFTWKASCGAAKKGSVAKYKNNGYIFIRIDTILRAAHRLAFLWMDGYFPENEIDHIDRNRANNSWGNIREVSRQCNMRNCKLQKRSKSGITGVYWDNVNKKWRAYVSINKKTIVLGRYKKKSEAAVARWEAEKKHGYPNCNTTSSAYLYLQKYSPLVSQKRP